MQCSEHTQAVIPSSLGCCLLKQLDSKTCKHTSRFKQQTQPQHCCQWYGLGQELLNQLNPSTACTSVSSRHASTATQQSQQAVGHNATPRRSITLLEQHINITKQHVKGDRHCHTNWRGMQGLQHTSTCHMLLLALLVKQLAAQATQV